MGTRSTRWSWTTPTLSATTLSGLRGCSPLRLPISPQSEICPSVRYSSSSSSSFCFSWWPSNVGKRWSWSRSLTGRGSRTSPAVTQRTTCSSPRSDGNIFDNVAMTTWPGIRVEVKRRSTHQRKEQTPVSLPPFSRLRSSRWFTYHLSDEHLENITEPKTFNLFCANHYLILIIFKTVSNWILLQAYKNHWVLRTSPDDWFFPVIRRIAQVRSSQMYIQRENTLNCKVVDDNALHPEVQKYLGRGQPVLGLKVTRLPSSSYIDQNQ